MLKIPLKGFLNDRIQDKMIFIHTKTPSNAVKKLIQNTGVHTITFSSLSFSSSLFRFSFSLRSCLLDFCPPKKKNKIKVQLILQTHIKFSVKIPLQTPNLYENTKI